MTNEKALELLEGLDGLIETVAQQAEAFGYTTFYVEDKRGIISVLAPEGDPDKVERVWLILENYLANARDAYKYNLRARQEETKLEAISDDPDMNELKEMIELDVRTLQGAYQYAVKRCQSSRELLLKAMVG